ncbi:condensation domain-containing protein [Chitinophaga tropicalis]|uniref:Condensation domain-containing protein n=1 Tax=Chitinophaga tropicalis TaxID=2683588 RepID=A0A7K1UAN2_9BACT|nr:condensation domain-containing protein [Chitinophaga tropicalis]MVT11413.1 hypothetical protein [Chitinophaga tropicalis]
MIEPLNSSITEHPVTAEALKGIPIAPAADFYELSYAQKRILAASRAASGRRQSNLLFFSFVDGPLDIDAVEKAVAALIARHESLRTSIVEQEETAWQHINSAGLFSLKVNYIDISNYENKHELTQEIIHEEQSFAFDLQTGPLMRVVLIHSAAEQFILIFSVHHLISDDRSLEIIVREFFMIYNAFRQQKENPLPDLRIQYKDFVAWKNAQLKGDRLWSLENFWLNYLQDKWQAVKLPEDFPGNSLVFPGEGMAEFEMSSELTARLKEAARLNEVNLFIALVGVVAILLNRYSGQEDIIVGAPVTTRDHPELENQVGQYMDLLPVSIRLEPAKDSLTVILEKIRNTTREVLRYYLYPYDMLAERMIVSDNRKHIKPFNILVQLDNGSPKDFPEVPGLSVHNHWGEYLADHTDIIFKFRTIDNYIKTGVVYNTALFKRSTINRINENLLHITRLTTEDLNRAINSIDLIELSMAQPED